jgi:hypothetical protein
MPCELGCIGVEELCDLEHAGFDDDCDGAADEGCPCVPGTAQSCFLGDATALGTGDCSPGVQTCNAATLTWNDCVGGRHATENCSIADPNECHGITTRPFVPVSLASSIGNFGADALAESWEVACPAGGSTCPIVDDPAAFAPLVVGEHTILYTKTTAQGMQSCEPPLYVRQPGLHVELEWEHPVGVTGVDLDLHLHRPDDPSAWDFDGTDADTCGWGNCTVSAWQFADPSAPAWFGRAGVPPDPVDWWLYPDAQDNDCYFEPMGQGAEWDALDQGCHHPRLGTSNISCDPLATDPDAPDYCHAERIDLDFPGLGSWYRIAVHYYSNHGEMYSVHPRVRISCDGALAGDFGPAGFYEPEAPVTFEATDAGTRVWLVADVAFVQDACETTRCVVAPLHQDAMTRTPLLSTKLALEQMFGPPLPPPP